MKLRFTYEYPDMDHLKKRAIPLAHKEAGTAAVGTFAEQNLWRRFTGELEGQLGWAPRDSRYTKRKLASRRTSSMMVFSRRTMKAVERSVANPANIRVTGKKVGIMLRGLGPQFKRAKRGARVKVRKELTVFRAVEAAKMGSDYMDRFVKFLNGDPRARKRVKKKVG